MDSRKATHVAERTMNQDQIKSKFPNYESKEIKNTLVFLLDDIPRKYTSRARQGAEGYNPTVRDHNELALAHALYLADHNIPIIPAWGPDSQSGCGCKYREAKISKEFGGEFTPCHSPGKHPKRNGWQALRTTDPIDIQKMFFRIKGRQNIAVATGGKEGIIIIDIDGDTGKSSLATLQKKYSELPKTVTVQTGSGGQHLYYRSPHKISNKASSVLGPKIDVRGDGGLAIAPGSLHPSGNYYVFEEGLSPLDVPVADLPEWLVELLRGEKPETTKSKLPKLPKSSALKSSLSNPDRWLNRLQEEIGDGQNGSGFDGPIYSAMCKYHLKTKQEHDAEEFISLVKPVILNAECKDQRNVHRYATDEYLQDQYEKARRFASTVHAGAASDELSLSEQLMRLDSPASQAELLGEHYAMVTVGKQMIMATTPESGQKLEFINISDFHHKFSNVQYSEDCGSGAPKLKPSSRYFVDSQHCRRYDMICFEPDSSKVPKRALNSWTGFSVQPAPGDWSNLKTHIHENVCDRNDSFFEWLLDWMAQIIQQPGRKSGSAVAFIGGKGTGKTKVVEWLSKAVAPYSITISQPKHLTGSFNAHLHGKILLVAEESFWAGDRQAASALKHLITSDTVMIEQKGKDAIEMSNHTRLIFTSNEKWVAPVDADGDSRRYFILRVADHRKNDADYFAAIDEQMNNGGLEAMIYELLERRPAHQNWSHLRQPPKTDALAQQRLETLTPAQNKLITSIEGGRIEGRDANGEYFLYFLSEDFETNVARSQLKEILERNANLHGGKGREFWEKVKMVLGDESISRAQTTIKFFTDANCDQDDQPQGNIKDRPCVFPPLSELRKRLRSEFGYDMQ